MEKITKVQRLTQALQLTAAIMIAVRAGLRLRAEVERAVLAEVARAEVASEGDVPNLFDTAGLGAMVKRMQEAANAALRNAPREAEGRD